MKTKDLVALRTEAERDRVRCIQLDPQQVTTRDIHPFHASALQKVNGGTLYTEGTIPILQQLLMHDCVRLPIRSVSEADFERLYGIDIAVAERLVELGFLLPILTHRALENWEEDYPHLDSLIKQSISAGDRFEEFLFQVCRELGLDYEATESNSTALIDNYARTHGLAEMEPYEQPWTTTSGRFSCIKRLTWLQILHPMEGQDITSRIGACEPNSLTNLRLLYHHLVARNQAALGGVLVADRNTLAVHQAHGTSHQPSQASQIPEFPAVFRALQAKIGGDTGWPAFPVEYLQSRAGQNRVVDWLEANRTGHVAGTRRALRDAVEKLSVMTTQGRIDEDQIVTQLRDCDAEIKSIQRHDDLLRSGTKVAYGLGGLAIAAATKDANAILAAFIGIGTVFTGVKVPDWIAEVLVKASASQTRPTTQLVRAISQRT